MFTKPIEETIEYLKKRTLDFGRGCDKAYVSLSGGVDSADVVAILCEAYGRDRVVAMFRDIKNDPKHLADVRKLQEVLGFQLIVIDANPLYEEFLRQCKAQFGQDWVEEGSQEAEETGWESAYSSLKSRFTTPLAGFIAKAVDGGRGRIFGTGNAEEDILLRYFDKFGDGAVDNNILAGLTKMEVRQIALWFGQKYEAGVFRKIAEKIPSADLKANGDKHNDENELNAWAKNMGFAIQLSYGDLEREGNIAWLVKEDLDQGVITGEKAGWDERKLRGILGYTDDEMQLVQFVRIIERSTRHKQLGIPGVTRLELRRLGLVD